MWEATFAIRHHGCPVSDTSAEVPAVHLENISKVEVNGRTSKRLLRLRGESDAIERFAETFREQDSVERFEQVSETASGSKAYFTTEILYGDENPSMHQLISNHGCYQQTTVSVQEGIENWVVYSENKNTLHSLIEDIEKTDNDLTLYRSVELGESGDIDHIESATLLSQLTERQQTVLRTALDMGYYDADSDVAMEDVGDVLDVHQSTVWEHINKVENKILQRVGEAVFPAERDGAAGADS